MLQKKIAPPNKIIPAAVPVLGDARDALERLIDQVAPGEFPDWIAEFHACNAIEDDKVVQFDLRPDGGNIRMGEVVRNQVQCRRQQKEQV